MHRSYPRARYHFASGQMRVVMSPEEEAELGPAWGDKLVDVKYPRNPPPIPEIQHVPPVFSIKLPGVE